MNARDGFDRVFAALSASRSYREAMRAATPELPEWLIPFNGIGGDELARIAREIRVGEGDSFVDLACEPAAPASGSPNKPAAPS